jgi:sugar phosphate isomerase/epimerase
MTMQLDPAATFSRRAFLQTAAAGAAAAPVLARAAEPIVRMGPAKMKLSLAAYSFNSELPTGWPKATGGGSMTMLGFIDYCAELQLDATELTSYYFPNPLTPDYVRQVKERTFRLGLDISGTAIGNDFCVAEGPARDEQLAVCRQWIDFAAELGAPVIRIFAGQVPEGDSEEQALDRCVAGINESLEHAALRGVALALENHGGITATSEQLLAIVKRVDPSPWFGVNLDSGNFHTADPYADLEKIAPYALNAQIKVMVEPEGGHKQPADLARVVDILRSTGYRGYVVLEYEESDPRGEIPGYIEQLRELIG